MERRGGDAVARWRSRSVSRHYSVRVAIANKYIYIYREEGGGEREQRRSRRMVERTKEKEETGERGGPWIYIPVNHFEPSAARLKFSRGRADVIKTNYAYGTVMPHHFVP